MASFATNEQVFICKDIIPQRKGNVKGIKGENLQTLYVGGEQMKKEEKPLSWEIVDPKPPIIRSGHLEDRKQ